MIRFKNHLQKHNNTRQDGQAIHRATEAQDMPSKVSTPRNCQNRACLWRQFFKDEMPILMN
jgi:hypothetical protein